MNVLLLCTVTSSFFYIEAFVYHPNSEPVFRYLSYLRVLIEVLKIFGLLE